MAIKKTYEIKCEPITPGYYTQAIWQEEILNEKLEVIQERKLIKESEYIVTGKPKLKYNIYYFENDLPATSVPPAEFHSEDGINGNIREGYVLKE